MALSLFNVVVVVVVAFFRKRYNFTMITKI